jgi:hypothetical protein
MLQQAKTVSPVPLSWQQKLKEKQRIRIYMIIEIKNLDIEEILGEIDGTDKKSTCTIARNLVDMIEGYVETSIIHLCALTSTENEGPTGRRVKQHISPLMEVREF